MALILPLAETIFGIPAPQAYAVIREISTEGKTEVRVLFSVYFSKAQRDAGGMPIDSQQCLIPLTALEPQGNLYLLSYQWAKANMPYFANAVDG